MVRFYDNWERLVEAVLRREQLRQLCLEDSRSPSIRSFDSDFSPSSSCSRHDDTFFRVHPSARPQPDNVKLKLAQSVDQEKKSGVTKVSASKRTRNAIWKGLSIFRGFSFKKDYNKEEREVQWAKAQRTFHGLEHMKLEPISFSSQQINEDISLMTEHAKRGADIKRLQELHTLKGHIESLVKKKGLDIDSIHHYYTI